MPNNAPYVSLNPLYTPVASSFLSDILVYIETVSNLTFAIPITAIRIPGDDEIYKCNIHILYTLNPFNPTFLA